MLSLLIEVLVLQKNSGILRNSIASRKVSYHVRQISALFCNFVALTLG